MTESDALRICRKAVLDAQAVVGDDRNALMEELNRAADRDPVIEEAFVMAGILFLQAELEMKH
ncbi:hypothetical protein [Burkholderia gladioli]|uniref:hypothetical protein n=1 Tax=Burkholderia gladioli TaxID=28095 RepID=UPI001641A7CE|nr:hypothetical protein [Burkholderia gladioli]